MNGHYSIGIDQMALFKEALKHYSKEEILKAVEMNEELFENCLKVDLNTQCDQMAIKLYFRLESLIPIPDYLEFKNRMKSRYIKRLEKFNVYKKRHLLPSTSSHQNM